MGEGRHQRAQGEASASCLLGAQLRGVRSVLTFLGVSGSSVEVQALADAELIEAELTESLP